MNFHIDSIKSIFNFRGKDLGILSLTLFCILTAGILYISLKYGIGLYLLGAVLGIALIIFYVKFPKYWLYSIALISFLFFTPSDAGIGIIDIFYGGLVIAGSMIWIFWKIFVHKEKIVENIADWVILFFYIFVILNLFVALANDIAFMEWVRAYILISSLLIYFPFKYYIKEKKDIQNVLSLFGITLFVLAIQHFKIYQTEGLANAVYAFQLGKSISSHQALFCSGIFFSLLFFVNAKNSLLRVFFILISSIFIGVLILTYSRIFWFFAFFEIILFLIYLTGKQRIILITGLLVISLLAAATLLTIFKEKSKIILQLVENRAVSATKGTKDLSFHLRLLEYDQAEKGIKESPWGGIGFGNIINFYEPLNHLTFHTKNIHNGYYFLTMAVGFPLSILLFFPMIYYLISGEHFVRKFKDNFYKPILLASVCTIIIVLAGNTLSNQLLIREGGMIMGISFALISSISNKIKQSNNISVT